MRIKNIHLPWSKLIVFTGVLLFLALAYSFFRSGLLYVFDNDELSQAQVMYLMSSGYQPFADFFTVYSPVFQWLLLPVFSWFGFSFSTLFLARYFMMALFLLRFGMMVWLVKRIASVRVASFFSFLLFLDTFTVVTVFQIRPDNFMMLIYNISLVFLFLALLRKKSSDMWWLLTGAGWGLMIVVSIKSIVLLGVSGICLFAYLAQSQSLRKIVPLLFGAIIPICMYFVYFILQGTLWTMLQNLLIDAPLTNTTILYPLPPGNFYWPNQTFFGSAGKPLTLVYVWILPILAGMGIYRTIVDAVTLKMNPQLFLRLTLAITLVVSWLSLFRIGSVFIQYYLPISWLFAFFGAFAFDDFFKHVSQNKNWKNVLYAGFAFVLLAFVLAAIRANIGRSNVNTAGQEHDVQRVWSVIPPNAKVFPNYLFRPLVYPLIYGYFYGDMPQSILTRFGSIENYLEQGSVEYLLLDGYHAKYLPLSTMAYINKHYKVINEASNIWKRDSLEN